MNYKLKKTLLIGSAVLVPTAIIGIATGVYFATPVTQRISEKGIFSIRLNENLNNEGYKYDFSATYGSPTSSSYLSRLINNEILHIKSEGEFKYDQTANDGEGKIIQPSYQSLSFANANAIVLTFIDSSMNQKDLNEDYLSKNPDKCFQLVFNSDEAEISPTNWGINDVVINKDSKNPKSINNSSVFGKIIAKGTLAKKPLLDGSESDIDTSSNNFVLAGLGVTFNTDAKWVDSNGNETKYNICAKDMFYSIKRTWLYDTTYRRSHGGTKELDAYFISKTQTSKRFLETSKFPNEYLFDFFGIDKNKLYNEKTAIQNVWIDGVDSEPVQAFTFSLNIFDDIDGSVKKDLSYSINEIIEKYLSNTVTMCLAPSQYIDELVKQNGINSTPSGTITDEAAKYGIYTYGQTRETTLYASTYIPTSSISGREIFEYNKHYANKKWVDSVEKGEVVDGKTLKTVNKVILEYTNGIDSSTFINQSFTSFLNGTLSQIDYSQISDAQKQKLYGNGSTLEELIKNSKENGLQETKKVNISNLTTRMVWQANPIDNDGNFKFNDIYSKLVYGGDKNELKVGTISTANSFFAGYGFAFRLLIQASINWQSYIAQAYTGTRDVWLSGAAQNAKFSSTDANSKSPFDYADSGMNDLIYFDENGDVQVSTITEMKKLAIMSAEQIKQEYGDEAAKDIQKTKLQAPPTQFKKIQSSMKALLDKFYKENELDSSKDKITWEIAYPFADQDENKCNATKYIVENVINEIDPRLNAKFFKPTTRDEMLNAINQYKGAFNANLWSYDYEGIGSYIAAFTSEGSGTNISSAIGIFSKDVENDPETYFGKQEINGKTINRPTRDVVKKLQTAYPKFTELSKYIREELNKEFKKPRTITVKMSDGSELEKTLNSDEKYYVENWDYITNEEMFHVSSFFKVQSIFDAKQTVYTEDEAKKIESNPWNINPVSVLPSLFKKFESDASWQIDEKLNEEQKGQQWVELIKELNSIKGVSIDTESSVDKLSSINYTLFLREYIIPISKYGLQFYQDFKYEVTK